jgi:hypothetical protein
VNGIPEAVVTDIAALLDNGSVDEAASALDSASTARTADVTAEAHTADAEKDLDAFEKKQRIIKYNAEVVFPKADIVPPQFKPTKSATSGSTQTVFETINVHLPKGARHTDIARAMNRSTRRNGRRFGNPQVHYARR